MYLHCIYILPLYSFCVNIVDTMGLKRPPAAIKVCIELEPRQRFGFHNFRHSLATFLISKGKDVKTILGLLRHAKSSTTLDLYSQAMDESKLAAQRDIALAITGNRGAITSIGGKTNCNRSKYV